MQIEHVAGTLRGPENLYDNVTRTVVTRVGRILPASEGEVQDNEARLQAYQAETASRFEEYQTKYEDYKAKSEARFEKYRDETTGIINALVVKTNTLTPVCFYPPQPPERATRSQGGDQASYSSYPCRGTMAPMV